MAAAQHGNGPNPERTKECVARIEAIADRKEAAHMAYMRECSVFAEDTKAVYEEAKTAWGINRRALKTVVKVRAAERRVEAMRDALEGDEQETFDQIRHALGDLADTPLGRSATGEDDDEDLRGTDQKEREAVRKERQPRARKGDAALNAAASEGPADNGASTLADGIKPLHH